MIVFCGGIITIQWTNYRRNRLTVTYRLRYNMLFYKLLMVSSLLWGPCLAQEDVSVANINDIVIKSWEMLGKVRDRKDGPNGRSASMSSLERFFKRYESETPLSYNVEVTEDDFLMGTYNWMADFGSTEEVARACFRLLNLDYAPKLFLIDTDLRVLFSFLDYNWNKRITEKEFAEGYQNVLRPLPFAVMFLRHDTNTDEILDETEFFEMVNEWDENANGKISEPEFSSWWESGGYGTSEAAHTVFTALDEDNNGVIDQKDADSLLKRLTENGTASLDFDQFVMIDNLIFGMPKYRKTKEGQKTLKIHSGRFLGLTSPEDMS